jgi:peptide/nickel transport system permease protein
MRRALLQRLCLVPLIGFVVVTIVFVLLRAIPGNAADLLAAQAIGLTTEQRAELVHDLNLDDSMLSQYGAYLRALPHLNLGLSYYSGRDVTTLLADALPATIELAVAAMAIALVLGVLTGAIAAGTRGRWPDSVIRFFSTLTFSLPWFALGVLAIIVFGVVLEWLPIFGRFSAGTVYKPTTGFVLLDAFIQRDFSLVGPWLEHLVLPALTLGLTMTGFLTRITRAAVLETMSEPYIRTARMVGLKDRQILVHHVMRNASIPILTVAGLQFGALLGGAVITEVVFAYPGVGSLLVTAILQHDYFVAQGAALAVGLMFTVVSGLVDVGALALDPRLRHAT